MKPSWSIFDCRQLISFRLPLTIETIDSELRLVAVLRRAARERGAAVDSRGGCTAG
jgi:hypothetical protein